MYRELLIGCGSRHEKLVALPDAPKSWVNLTTLDYNADHQPDVVWDLKQHPLPFSDEQFDEIHAYEVLEHLAQQGDYKFFFEEFTEYHRLLTPGGIFYATVPAWTSEWAWGDPSHTRVITPGTLVFLDQDEYTAQVGKTALSDFRYLYKVSFKRVFGKIDGDTFIFILRKDK